ncbi:hypothetical protein ACVLVH_003451 [Kluyvera sp. 1366]
MTTKYFALLTNQGAAKLANAAALGTKVDLKEMAVGDGGGTLPTPDPAQTKLIGEKRRAQLNSLSIDAANNSQIIAEQIIPESEGGFWIREIGLYDADGVLIAVANCAETYKPQLAEGSGRTQTVRMIIIVNSSSAVTLKIDPAVVLATRKYVDDAVILVKAYSDKLLKEHVDDSDPHTQYLKKIQLSNATDSDSETQAATSKAVKSVMTEVSKKALLNGNANEQFAAKDASADAHVVNRGQMNTGLGKRAWYGGDSNQDFAVLGGTTEHSAVANWQLVQALSKYAALTGNASQKFWVLSAPGDVNAAVPVSLLNSGLAGKANLAGNQYQNFDIAQASSWAHAVRLDQFQSGSNGNGAWNKLPGGGQWCRTNMTIGAKSNATWTFPAGFSAAPCVLIGAINGAPSVWLTGVGPNNCGIYNNNDGPLNINLLAFW